MYFKYMVILVYISQFSDSILIISKDDSYASFGVLVIIMRHVIYMLIIQGIAVKGACAHGRITVDKEKSIFFGQPIIDAYLLEEDVHYYGIVCHNSFEKQVNKENYIDFYEKIWKKDGNFWESDFFIAKTKLKSGEIIHANVNWYLWGFSCYQNVVTALKNIQMQVSGKPRIYVDNTLEMANRALKL